LREYGKLFICLSCLFVYRGTSLVKQINSLKIDFVALHLQIVSEGLFVFKINLSKEIWEKMEFLPTLQSN